jgi:ectoine hydroxylase
VAVRIRSPVPDDLGSRRLAFEHDGFVVIPGALAPSEVATVRSDVARVYARHADPDTALHHLAFIGEALGFVKLVDHPSTIPVVADVLGDNIYCYHCHLDVHPGRERPRDVWMWHQDGGIINRDLESTPRPRIAVKVAFFLTDLTTSGRGNFVVLPGSHRCDRIARPAGPSMNDVPGATPVLAHAGDAVVFDRRLWHMRSPNTSERTREALFLAYTYRWIRPRDDMVVPDHICARATAAQRQLLGHADRTVDHWMPDLTPPPLKARLEELRAADRARG